MQMREIDILGCSNLGQLNQFRIFDGSCATSSMNWSIFDDSLFFFLARCFLPLTSIHSSFTSVSWILCILNRNWINVRDNARDEPPKISYVYNRKSFCCKSRVGFYSNCCKNSCGQFSLQVFKEWNSKFLKIQNLTVFSNLSQGIFSIGIGTES